MQSAAQLQIGLKHKKKISFFIKKNALAPAKGKKNLVAELLEEARYATPSASSSLCC
jgi:hypothetical protein